MKNVPLQTLALVALAAIALAIPVSVASAGDSVRDRYTRYAKVREQIISCSLDRAWRHLSGTQKRRCVRLRRLYTVWSDPNYGGTVYHLHCRTSRRCPAAPIGEPDPRDPIPAGAIIVR